MTRRRLTLAAALAGLLPLACGRGTSSAPANTMPSAAQHAKYFPIAAGDVHGPAAGQASADCNGCHQDTSTGQPSVSFLVFSCTGCHLPVANGRAQHDAWASLLPLHATVAGFPATQPADAAFSDACRACHPAGTVGPPADHGDYFDLSAAGKHAFPGARITKCGDCHTSGSRTATTDFACATCHAADATPLAAGHAAVPDLAADPTNPVKCLACHANGVLPATSAGAPVTVAGHAAAAGGFLIGTGVHSGAAGGACLTCHPANRAPSTTPPHWDYARDFKQTSCVACHVTVGGTAALHDDQAGLATIHTSVATFASTVASLGLSAACLSCHADGQGGAPANHEALFPRAAGTKHAGLACASCHTNPANRQDLTALACLTCHQGLTGAGAYPGTHQTAGAAILLTTTCTGGTSATVPIAPTGADCLKCHADAQVDLVGAHPADRNTFGTGPHTGAGCLTCHVALRADKPYPAADFTKPSPASQSSAGCATCHGNGCGGGG